MKLIKEKAKVVLLTSFGQIVEYYDIFIFVTLAGVISQHFFVGSVYTRYIYIFGVFALGYLIRPLGGMIFGHLGDTKGRKKPFIFTIMIMSISTFLVGLVPSYKSIGLLAPIILILLRIIQGFSLGGELPGGVAFVHEHMPEKSKAVGLAIVYAGVGIGMLAASVTVTVLFTFLTKNQLSDFGWRIPFFVGGGIGTAVFMLRWKVADTPIFRRLLQEKKIVKFPLKILFKNGFTLMILGLFINVSIIYGSIFMTGLPSILTKMLHYYSVEYISEVQSYSLIVGVVSIIAFSFLIGKKKINAFFFFIIINLIAAGIMIPVFMLVETRNPFLLLISYFFISVLSGASGSVVFTVLAEMFPPKIKYTALGIVISLGAIIAAGLVPLMTTYSFEKTGSLYSIAIFITIILLLSVGACICFLLRSRKYRPIS
ncbi:MAG: MHS family MFS transporter [bacterium]|nr:MHS family MFS transporter [bacterium]